MPSQGFWKGRRVLVTGHTGFKGAWLSLWLRHMGAKVHGYALAPDTDPSLFSLAGLAAQVEHAIGDVRDTAGLCAAMRGAEPEIVFHLAAQALVRRSYAQPLETLATNVMGTANLLESMRDVASVKSVVVVTTDKCYDNREWYWPYRENDHLGGRDPYSASKACAELVTSAYRDSFLAAQGVAVGSARAGNVLGGGDWSEDRLVPDCMRAFARGETVRLRNPDAVRPWQHVLEPLAGYLLLAERMLDGKSACAEAFNFGPAPADARSVSWIVDRAARSWGEGACWEADHGGHPHEARLLSLDASKARAVLGWQPVLSLDQCVDWTVKWYRSAAAGADAAGLCIEQIEQYMTLMKAA